MYFRRLSPIFLSLATKQPFLKIKYSSLVLSAQFVGIFGFKYCFMKLSIATKVKKPYKEVFNLFTKELFVKLSPPFPSVRLLRFDGSSKQDKVIVELNFFLFKQLWESVITEKNEDENEIYFVDEGVKLPFFLKKWRHKHRIIRDGDATQIIDDIEFETPFKPFDMLFYPIMYLQFWYRKPIYRKVFDTK